MGTKQTDIPSQYSPDWLEKLDGRTAIARAVNERLAALLSDLGGADTLSYQQRSLAKRAIWTEAVIEQSEAALARGEDVDVGRLTQANNSLIGLFKALGLDRKSREVPSLAEYLNQAGTAP